MALRRDSGRWDAARDGEAWVEIFELYNLDQHDAELLATPPKMSELTMLARSRLIRMTSRALMSYINMHRAVREEFSILRDEYAHAERFYCATLRDIQSQMRAWPLAVPGSSAATHRDARGIMLAEVRYHLLRRLAELRVHKVL